MEGGGERALTQEVAGPLSGGPRRCSPHLLPPWAPPSFAGDVGVTAPQEVSRGSPWECKGAEQRCGSRPALSLEGKVKHFVFWGTARQCLWPSVPLPQSFMPETPELQGTLGTDLRASPWLFPARGQISAVPQAVFPGPGHTLCSRECSGGVYALGSAAGTGSCSVLQALTAHSCSPDLLSLLAPAWSCPLEPHSPPEGHLLTPVLGQGGQCRETSLKLD